MKRVAEIIHIVESEREQFINTVLNLDDETLQILWLCGVRKQQYFALNDLIFMTFEYEGNDFNADMKKMSLYLESRNLLVKKRRREIPVSELDITNWWAPVKKLGAMLEKNPFPYDEQMKYNADYLAMLDGLTEQNDMSNDISFDENDWEETIRI